MQLLATERMVIFIFPNLPEAGLAEAGKKFVDLSSVCSPSLSTTGIFFVFFFTLAIFVA
jgi:hypothetical protein